MSSVCRIIAVFAGAILACPQTYAADPPPGKEQIARWIEQLGDKDFERRQEASRRLWAAGEPAEKALEAAVKSDDAEVRRRAGDILAKFKWGIYPDTPKHVADLIGRYQAAEKPAKMELMRALFDDGVAGCRALVKIATADDDPNLRAHALRVFGSNVPRYLPVALADNKFDLIERLLDLGVEGDDLNKRGLSHYCAYWLLRGKIDERIKEWSDKPNRTKQQSEVLAYLYRAKGDLRAARGVAEKADLPGLVDRLLYEKGDWKELATRDLVELPTGPERFSYRAAYRRLAGDTAGFEEGLAAFRKAVEDTPLPERHLQSSYFLAKLLFANDRPEEALQVLERSEHYAMLFELWCAQLKYREAFALVDKARKEEHKELPLLEILEARQRYHLGEKDKALALFARRAAEIKPGNDLSWYADLVDAEYRVGLKDEAFAHAAAVLTISADAAWRWRLLAKLFPGRDRDAEVWWTILGQRKPSLTALATMKELRDLFDGKYTEKEVAALIEEAQGTTKNLHPALVERHWLALANTAHAAKLDKLERSCLEKGGTETLQRLGDLLAEKKDWAHAAAAYRQAWDRATTQPLPLLLAGKALVQAGDEKEGKKLVEQSHWLPLGDEGIRNEFEIALRQRGYIDDARRENELIQRLGEVGSFYGAEAELRTTIEALRQKDYLKAAAGSEHTLLRSLKTNVHFIQNLAYLRLPTQSHCFRARGLLDAGRFDEAQKEIAYCQKALPGNVDLADLLVPELARRGHKKEADDLFARTAAVYEKVIADFPKGADAHNSLAWLSVCCNRDLERALAHAQKAVELSPATAGHHDTLAEIYFQQGQNAQAVAEQKKAVELDPKKVYFRKQLKRIEAGDPKAERPSELDDDDD